MGTAASARNAPSPQTVWVEYSQTGKELHLLKCKTCEVFKFRTRRNQFIFKCLECIIANHSRQHFLQNAGSRGFDDMRAIEIEDQPVGYFCEHCKTLDRLFCRSKTDRSLQLNHSDPLAMFGQS